MNINDKIDMLTIIERLPNDKYRNKIFKCRCDCGNIVIRNGRTLKTSRFHSCGCKRLVTDVMTAHCKIAGKASADKRVVNGINVEMLFNPNNISTNTSGYKGISWCKANNKWHVYVGYKSYRCNLGYYDNIHTASKIRETAIEHIKNDTFEDYFYELRGFRIEDKLQQIK